MSRHCWHQQWGEADLTEKCCWCGESRYSQLDRSISLHGPHATGDPYIEYGLEEDCDGSHADGKRIPLLEERLERLEKLLGLEGRGG